ncbi:Ldh family oxidoreductase [Brevibacterium sp. 91QC2O2]|uniref:Ldh family oxidoreductase n=1 Tax=Brevibacterium TaxID=1696 RepID=UPI00211CAE2B|nr:MULTISPECIES: Ldh family oxidoreductase [unclassified Brevibacterium]MCQ9367112.1 Ldh family oxidoreductase [Brevibacterium sp. 91QC2O2]MCQ9385441.1 Ldh family oxidoreductase [Brevibacterium sp. 68QC2CO]
MKYDVTGLLDLAAAALQTQHVPAEDARLTARSLVLADQRGINSHGLLRLPLYVSALREGGIKANPEPVLRATGATATLNGDAGLGQVVMQRGVDWAVQAVAEYGIAAISVENSSHYGAGQFWTDQLVARGLVGFLTSSTGPTVAPYGGVSTVLGTNPLTIAMPSAGTDPLTVDMATSNGAFGKVMAAKQAGRPIPAGWAVDAQGNPTTDPQGAIDGALVPFGDHKGSGVSVLLEGLASALNTATYAFDTQDIWDNPASRMNNGHFLIAFDTERFAGRSAVETKVAALQDAVHGAGARAADGTRDTLLVPGEKEYTLQREYAVAVELGDALVADLRALAAELDVDAAALTAVG